MDDGIGRYFGLGGRTSDTMPGMTGPELQHELARRRHDMTIVFITAQADESVRPRVLAEGAVECLFKPFSETALLNALDAALRAG